MFFTRPTLLKMWRLGLAVLFLALNACLGSDQVDISSNDDFSKKGLRIGRLEEVSGITVTEGSLAEIRIELNYVPTNPVSFKVRTSSTNSTANSDYLPISTSVTLPSGTSLIRLPLLTLFDKDVEFEESVQVEIYDVVGAPVLNDQITLYLKDHVPGSKTISSISDFALGQTFTCIVEASSGRPRCWGNSAAAQFLATSSALGPEHKSWRYDISVSMPYSPIKLIATANMLCAIYNDNDPWCVGRNDNSKLKDDAVYEIVVPVQLTPAFVSPTVKVTSMAIGSDHSCFLYSNGAVGCRGLDDGRLGHAPNGLKQEELVVGLSNVSQITAGDSFTCVLSAKKVYCWGQDSFGELGQLDSVGFSSAPLQVTLSGPAVAIASSGNHSCAALEQGGVECWGSNLYQESGASPEVGGITAPAKVNGITQQVLALAVAPHSNCALLQSQEIYCWGNNGHGELGQGAVTQPSATALKVNMPSNPTKIRAGISHFCADTEGSLVCWGSNYFAESSGVTAWADRPTSLAAIESIKALSFSEQINSVLFDEVADKTRSNIGCALKSTGEPVCWGGFSQTLMPFDTWSPGSSPMSIDPSFPGTGSQALASGDGLVCLIDNDDKVRCIGRIVSDRSSFSVMAGLDRAKDIAIQKASNNNQRLCAISKADGKVYCAGSLLCNNPLSASKVFPDFEEETIFSSSSKVAASLAIGAKFNCVLSTEGKVYCWGNSSDGQAGTGSYDTCISQSVSPAVMPKTFDDQTIVKISAGLSHVCALSSAGRVACWGSNFYGQLGIGKNTFDESWPQEVGELGTVTDIYSGSYHTCAIIASGAVKCWGDNKYNQLGIGRSTKPVLAPVSVQGIAIGAEKLMGGNYITCALTKEGRALCWGPNYDHLINHNLSLSLRPAVVGSF